MNASLAVNPSLPAAGEAVKRYLEWQTHRRSLEGAAVWYALYRGRAVGRDAPDDEARAAALDVLGFEPVSPDGSAYRYDPRRDEVVSRRHGSWRQPALASTLAPDAPMRQLLERFGGVRVDLRFREDGIHTTLTFARKAKP